MFLVVKCPIYTFLSVLGSQSKLLICGCGRNFCWFVVIIAWFTFFYYFSHSNSSMWCETLSAFHKVGRIEIPPGKKKLTNLLFSPILLKGLTKGGLRKSRIVLPWGLQLKSIWSQTNDCFKMWWITIRVKSTYATVLRSWHPRLQGVICIWP